MDEKVTPITSKAMLDSYSADAIGWMEPEQATAPSQRFMPEGKYDQDTAVKNKQVFADRFENFGPQVGVSGFTYGWQRPSDGKFIGLDQHHFLYRDSNGNQLGDPSSIGYVRIVKEGNTLFYDGKPNSKQLKELKDAAIESGMDLQNATPAPSQRFMPEGVDEDKFYSQLDRVITDKVPTRATAAQIMATIDPTRGSGVKAEEIKWSGIEQALASLEKDGKVSKEDLLNYLRNEGRVRFEEVISSEFNKDTFPQGWSFELDAESADGSGVVINPQGKMYAYANNESDARQLAWDGEKSAPKYAQYQLPGGENYREVVLAMPNKIVEEEANLKKQIFKLNKQQSEFEQQSPEWNEIQKQLRGLIDRQSDLVRMPSSEREGYTSSHFPNIHNYVAHMRTNERVDAYGRPGLFVEEFQSDRHQEGRKKGYKNTSSVIKEQRKDGTWHVELENGDMKNFYKERDADRYIEDASYKKIADAPFRTTWPLQLFKRALRDAVDSGKEWVGWTTGETQNDRFDLSKQIDRLTVTEDQNIIGSYRVEAFKDGGRAIDRIAKEEELPDIIGKDLAQKVLDDIQESKQRSKPSYSTTLSGLDLRVGGSGMKGFYDTMLPKEIGKYVKPFGGKVEKSEVATPSPTKRTDDLTDAELLQELNRKGDTLPIWKVSITPEMRQLAQAGQMRFLPEPVEKLSAFKGKRVQVLTSDLSLVGDVKYGEYTASFKGGPGYLDNDGWAFTDKAAADAFVTRWKKDGEPLIGLASLGSANHLNSLDARKAYAEKWKYLVSSGEIGEELANDHIKQAMKRIISSDSKNVKPDWRNAAKMIESADDLSNYFDKIPWAAAPMFYSKLTAKTLPIKYKKLVELGLDLESAAKEYRQPEFEGAELGDLYAIAEYDGSTPEYKPELNKAYPWRIKFKKKATLSEMHNVAKLTTDPRAFAKKKVGGRLGAQPLMVTGINLDKLMSGDIAGSAKPLVLKPETAKTKSNKAKQFGSGNPEAYRSYQQILAERNAKKPKKKSTAKGNSSAIANAAKLK